MTFSDMPPLETAPFSPQEARLSQEDMNAIHAVSFEVVLRPAVIAKCTKPAFFDTACAIGPVWKSIFSYLTMREIYTFMISSPLWAQCMDAHQLKNDFLMLKGGIQLAPQFSKSFERIAMFPMRIETAEDLEVLSKYDVGKIEFEVLDLFGTNIPSGPIVQLLLRSPKLAELNLQGCNHLIGRWSDLAIGSLPFVKKLNLSGDSIGAQSLPYLLYAVQNIEELDLSNYVGNDVHLHQNTNEPVLTNLRKLNLNTCMISSGAIIQFLRVAVRLEELQIDDYPCADPLDFLGFEPNSLLSLRSVSFYHSPLVRAGFVAFLKAAPNLQKIDLNDVKSSVEDQDQHFPLSLRGFFDDFEEGSLSLLQEIDLGNTDVRPEDIERLLKVAPNLKTIRIEGCPDLVY